MKRTRYSARTLASLVVASSLVLSACTSTDSTTEATPTSTTTVAEATATNVAESGAGAAVTRVEPVGIPLEDDPAAPGYMTIDGDQVTINDMEGKPFTFVPGQVEDVINLWPASNAAMIALGAEDFFSGRVDIGGINAAWQEHISPTYAETKVYPTNPSPTAEELLADDPDLIIESRSSEDYANADLPTFSLYFSTFDEMKVAFWTLGTVLGPEFQQKAVDWAAMVDENTARVQEALAADPDAATGEEAPVVYYMQAQGGGDPTLLSTFASPSIITEWIEAAGGRYWVEELQKDGQEVIQEGGGSHGPNVSAELVLANPPEKIVIGGRNANDYYDLLLSADQSADNPWPGIIQEIGEDNIYKSPNGLFSWDRFGAEAALEILWAATIIHPEVFADPEKDTYIDMVEETQTFFRDFVGYDMTAEEAEAMLTNAPIPGAEAGAEETDGQAA